MLGTVFYTYLFLINIAAFALYGIDKRKAHYELWRIPEAVLLGLAIVGGAYGAGAGMLLFRHKTLHKAFLITVPVFLLLWMIVLAVLCYFS
jgi:uncharacterized membrane protein YsdA (DUF1294 family)